MLKTKAILGSNEASRILESARAEAQQQVWAVTIAVVDDGGHLLALERLDGCAPISSYIATEKARAAALGRRETRQYEEMINNGRFAFLSAPLAGALEGGDLRRASVYRKKRHDRHEDHRQSRLLRRNVSTDPALYISNSRPASIETIDADSIYESASPFLLLRK